MITARAITVTAQTDTKGYDGTHDVGRWLPLITSGTLAAGDTSGFLETFNNKNVGTGKTLTASGAVVDGNSGNNYAVTLCGGHHRGDHGAGDHGDGADGYQGL